MNRSRLLSTVMIAALAFVASAARAALPSAANSFEDPCIRVCPGGDMNYHIVVRDAANNPVAGSSIVMDFCACPGVVFCPLTGGEGYTIVNGCQVVATTNAVGIADIQIRAGGTCNGGPVRIFADGVLLANRTAVSSPDQNGDLTVNAADQGILAAKFPGPDPTGDFNCSAGLDPGDQAILASHIGHTCAVVVPVRPSTWGSIKTLYR